MPRRLIGWVLLAGVALIALVLVAAAAVAGAVWWTLPAANQIMAIPGLSASVKITLDQDGVPRIHAATERDAATALGYLHARDRMFQMDLMRRNASGRLSEIAGPVTLGLDRMTRVLGLGQRLDENFAGLDPETRAVLEAYARGVNAWISARGRFAAPEFLVFGAPAPWRPEDSLLWGRTMGLWLSANWRMKLQRLALSGKLDPRIVDELWPPIGSAGRSSAGRPPDHAAIDAAGRLAAALPAFPGPFTLPGKASNEWAVDGAHSATGAPLLAGDPHLAFGQPGIWYLARIETTDGILAGATAPGVPFLVIGHNGHIAWTFTTTGADVQDVFIETPVGPDSYQTPDGPKPFATREERIRVRGQADEILRVRETRHGPVISDLDGSGGDRVLAIAMGNLAPGDVAATGLHALNRARDVDEAGRAAGMISVPVQNLLVADRERIGQFVTGRVPVRRSPDGRYPVPGADGSHDWLGLASGAQLPRTVAPASGRLVNANERVAPASFPVFMGSDWFGDWRARRINQMLDATPRPGVEDFLQMQLDVRSAFAGQVLPVMLAGAGSTEPTATALLAHWDGTMAMDRPEPLIFAAWLQQFYLSVLAHVGIPPGQGGPRAETVAFALSDAGKHWCGESCAGLLAGSLNAAMTELRASQSGDPASWRWGNVHQAVFAHPILRALPILGKLTTARVPVAGDDTTVNAEARGQKFEAVHGPAFRGVFDLADLDRSRFVIAPGQSGHPLSRHATDFISRWRDNAAIALGPLPARVTGTIELKPGQPEPAR